MPSSNLILCYPLLLLPPIPPTIRVFSNESWFIHGNYSTNAWSTRLYVLDGHLAHLPYLLPALSTSARLECSSHLPPPLPLFLPNELYSSFSSQLRDFFLVEPSRCPMACVTWVSPLCSFWHSLPSAPSCASLSWLIHTLFYRLGEFESFWAKER